MAPELALLQYIKYEPFAVVIILYIVFRVPITNFFNFIWFKLTKKKKMSLEQLYAEEAVERMKRQKEVDNKFDAMHLDINHLRSKIAAVSDDISSMSTVVSNYEAVSDTMNKVNLENTLFNEALSPFRRLKAYVYLIAMGSNGRIKMKGQQLILHHKETWLDVQDVTSESLKFDAPEDKEYYDSTLDEINKLIYGIHSKAYADKLEELQLAKQAEVKELLEVP